MAKTKKATPTIIALSKMQRGTPGIVTYHFEDETILRAPVNKAVFFGEKGEGVSLTRVEELFRDTANDIGAIAFDVAI